jgi:hypothetical protein
MHEENSCCERPLLREDRLGQKCALQLIPGQVTHHLRCDEVESSTPRLQFLLGVYNIRRNWKKYVAIYGGIAVVVYGVIYLLFFSGLFGGGGSSPSGY